MTPNCNQVEPQRITPMGLLTNAQNLISGHGCHLLACVLLVLPATPALAQSRPQFTRRSTTIHWDKVPVRDAFARLSRTLGEPIFTDRRVDPERRISLDITNAASDEVLSQAAAAASLGTSRLGRLIYFGPPAAAGQLRTLAAIGDESIARFPADRRAALQRKQSLTWPRLAEPRQLVTKLVEDRGLRLVGAEQIPHDLWPAGSLSGLSFAEQLTVLLIGFDLTFVIDSQTGEIKLVPLSAPAKVTRRYQLPKGFDVDSLRQSIPGVELRVDGDDVVVDGFAEVHDQLRNLLRRQREPDRPPPVAAKTRKLYTLRVEQQPLQAVLQQLGQRLGWTIETDDVAIAAAGKSLEERVSFAVENVDEDELLRAMLRPAGLDHKRDGNRVRVFPRGR